MSAPLVVKIGGSTLDGLTPAWWDDLAAHASRATLVCVHGWSHQLAAHQRAHGREPVFLTDQHGHRSRFTDRAVLEDIREVTHEIRSDIGDQLRRRGLCVAACSGDEGGLLRAEQRALRWWRDGRLVPLTNLVGAVREVSADVLRERLGRHDALVVSPLACDPRHGTVNSDGDRAAASIAVALGTERLVLVTDVDHVTAAGRPLDRMRRDRAQRLAREVGGGMRKKLRAAVEAIDGGVGHVHVGADRVSALMAGAGTVIVR